MLLGGFLITAIFAGLMFARLNPLTQLGVALTFGVLLNALVVRPFLMPASTLLIGRALNRLAEMEQRRVEEEPRKRKRVA